MSRIGIKPIELKDGVEVVIGENNNIKVKGPKGELVQDLPKEIIIEKQDNQLLVKRPNDLKKFRALHGLTRSLLNNMVEGVTNGFEKKLVMNGVGYKAAMQGKKLVLNLGYSHPIEMEQPEDLTIEVPVQTEIIIKGMDKQRVGNFAAKVRSYRKPEPYKGKGIKYSDEIIRRKEGKTAK